MCILNMFYRNANVLIAKSQCFHTDCEEVREGVAFVTIVIISECFFSRGKKYTLK